jgi:hypothetical protein
MTRTTRKALAALGGFIQGLAVGIVCPILAAWSAWRNAR